MARIAKRLHGPAQLSNAAATKYTVPASTKTIVRHIHVSNPGTTAVNFTLSIGADAAAVRIFDAYTIPAGSVYDHFCYYILEAAEIIQSFGSVNNQLDLTINGDESIPS